MEFEKKFIQNYLTKRHFSGGKLMALSILGLCFILSQFYWDGSFLFSKFLAANGKSVYGLHEYWRLLTSLFVHGDMKHLLSNSLMLVFLLYFVSSFYGKLLAINVFIWGGVAVNAFCLLVYPENTFLVGASGGIYLLWGFWLILYFFIERQYTWFQRFLRAMGVFLILLVPTTIEPTTSYLAHYSGFLIGMFMGLIYYFYKRKDLHKYELWEYTLVSFDEDDDLTEILTDPKVFN